MKTLKKILFGLMLIPVVFLVAAALQPAAYTVTRSTTVAAPPAVVFAEVNDFHAWPEWSPWEGEDASMKRSYDGAAAGTGAIYGWSGNSKVGEGKMTITEAKAGELVRMRLEFVRPFQDTSTAEFTFRPAGNGTEVTWSMSGTKGFAGKAVGLLVSMDKLLGDTFAKGLAKLKTVAEAKATAPTAAPAIPAAQP